jgi:hypothetical protein
MKLKLMRGVVWVVFRLRLYYVWSKIYRFFFERKWRRIELLHAHSLEHIEEITGKMKWRKDTWHVLWDTISTPKATYGRFLQGEPAGDCDDISLFAVWCIEEYVDRSANPKGIGKIGLLSCPYIRDKGKGKIGGHNVGVFQYVLKGTPYWAWISNWHKGRILWRFRSLEDIVRAVVDEADGASLGWSFANTRLKMIRCGNAA